MSKRALALFVLAAAVAAPGCRSTHRASQAYQTVGTDPSRDTETARRLATEALASIDRGDFEEAEALLKRALAADLSHGPAHNNLGVVYFRTGRLYLAAWEFDYAARLMPNRPQPRNNLGLVLEQSDRFDDAIAAYADAVRSEPDNPEFIANLARARVRGGDRSDELRSLLEELLLKDPRPEWQTWARREVALFGDRPAPEQPLPSSP